MLEVSELNAYYGDAHVLHDIHLKVNAGQRVSLLGRNGAGKSTFLKSVMNAGPTVKGEVRFEGSALNALPAHQRARLGMALVPEDRQIFHHLNVLENIAMARHARAGRQALTPQQIVDRFAMLKPLTERNGGQLSGGQQQLVAIARAFAAGPRLLFLDEPTEGLAPVIVQSMADEILAICNESDAAVLLCEQNIWFARACTDYVYIIDTGRVVFDGDWRSFDASPEITRKYLSV
ncbi:ABC transporter ATP-binding protein [Alloalcanivorax mobilis]|uniref:ABC transporter ATP-binding protein n=1 Tax=Alloalcanivorax mobilis TaxID=2019569 RepID=UPI000B5B0D57|nr:ATP-binding cassette domain-containing protein [Alloalcanivorax mobilis]ASK34080.1 ABC transporter ATP-binding protein [Alcanivorax sp. N3-2A]|tara:strand:+ start:10423 stop:11124 length:702 start_codon:yes stop_codon:yes gene_type:complete